MPLFYDLAWGSWTDLDGPTNVAPAAVTGIDGNDAVVARTGKDGLVYVKFHAEGTGFGAWTALPAKKTDGSAMTTTYPPCLAVIGSQYYVFAVTPANTIYYSQYILLPTGYTWLDWREVPGAAVTGTHVAVDSKGALYMTGLDGQVWVNPDPTGSGSWSHVPGPGPGGSPFYAGDAPCAAEFNDGTGKQIGLLCKAKFDNDPYYLFPLASSYWTDLGGATTHPLAAASQAPSSDAGSWVFLVGPKGNIYVAGLAYPGPGTSWTEIAPTGAKITTDAGVAAASPLYISKGDTSQKVFLFATNSDNSVAVNIATVSFASFA